MRRCVHACRSAGQVTAHVRRPRRQAASTLNAGDFGPTLQQTHSRGRCTMFQRIMGQRPTPSCRRTPMHQLLTPAAAAAATVAPGRALSSACLRPRSQEGSGPAAAQALAAQARRGRRPGTASGSTPACGCSWRAWVRRRGGSATPAKHATTCITHGWHSSRSSGGCIRQQRQDATERLPPRAHP